MLLMIDWTQPLVSVVILNFNGKKFLNKCLFSVFNSNYSNFEVILVDNASTDGSIELAQENFSNGNLRIIRNSSNLGFAEGNNIGARSANGKYLVFLNNDTEVDSGWLEELVSVMESDYEIGVAQSKLLLSDRKTIDSAGDFINFYGYGWLRRHREEDNGQCNEMGDIFSGRGAAMIVQRQILMQVAYFDPIFFMLCEDVDLSWRIRLNGYKVVFIPRSVVYHLGSGTRRKHQNLVASSFYNTRNSLIMLIKNYNLRNLVIYGTANVLFQSTLFFSSLLTSNRFCSLSRLKGMIWILVHFKTIWKKRMQVQYGIRKILDEEIRKHMIKKNLAMLEIVWYLLYKNKTQFEYFINTQLANKECVL